MNHKAIDAKVHFSTLKGLSSIGQIWPSGCYEEYLPSQSHQARIGQYWSATGVYLKQAEAQVREHTKATG